jgi:hypothetical protein
VKKVRYFSLGSWIFFGSIGGSKGASINVVVDGNEIDDEEVDEGISNGVGEEAAAEVVEDTEITDRVV